MFMYKSAQFLCCYYHCWVYTKYISILFLNMLISEDKINFFYIKTWDLYYFFDLQHTQNWNSENKQNVSRLFCYDQQCVVDWIWFDLIWFDLIWLNLIWLNCIELYWIVLDWIALNWIGFNWTGLDLIGLDWIG